MRTLMHGIVGGRSRLVTVDRRDEVTYPNSVESADGTIYIV